MNLNKVMLIGRVTRDPELKTTTGGTSVVSFSLATNDTYKNKNDEKVEETEFHNCVGYGGIADTIGTFVKKGQEIYVEGKKKTRSWEKDGKKNYAVEIIIEKFQFGQKAKGSAEEDDEEEVTPHF